MGVDRGRTVEGCGGMAMDGQWAGDGWLAQSRRTVGKRAKQPNEADELCWNSERGQTEL